MKVIAIMGLLGACRCEKMKNLMLDDIEEMQLHLVVNIRNSKTGKHRVFMVVSVRNELANDLNLVQVYQKYIALRPPNVLHRRLFINCQKGKCTIQPVGINKFAKIPEMISKYLKISDASSYTGHCWRRTSASLLVDASADLLTLKRHGGRKFSAVAEGYLEDSKQSKISIATKILGDNNPYNNSSSILSSTSSTTSTLIEKLGKSVGVSIHANNCVFNFYVKE